MKDAGYIDEDSVIEKATYEGRNIKQQSKKSAKIISEEPERVERIISGEEALPSDISPVYFAGAVEEYGLQTGNRELLEKLAKSNFGGESSRAGSELRMAAEREPDSYVIKMKEIARARKEALEKRIGKKLQSAKKMARKEMERFKPKSNKVTWAGFINEIKCK
jgi:peptide subunit release factor RF-3